LNELSFPIKNLYSRADPNLKQKSKSRAHPDEFFATFLPLKVSKILKRVRASHARAILQRSSPIRDMGRSFLLPVSSVGSFHSPAGAWSNR
jgi:hypothetical protein